jgi:hypothetical protein
MTSLLHAMTLRWRLALLSAGLTFLVLCIFALFIGQSTASRIRGDFRKEMRQAMDNLLRSQQLPVSYRNGHATIEGSTVRIYAAPNEAVIRVLFPSGVHLAVDQRVQRARRGRPGAVRPQDRADRGQRPPRARVPDLRRAARLGARARPRAGPLAPRAGADHAADLDRPRHRDDP